MPWNTTSVKFSSFCAKIQMIVEWVGCLDRKRTNLGLVSNYCPIFVQVMCKNRDNCRSNTVCGQKEDKCRTSVSLLSHFVQLMCKNGDNCKMNRVHGQIEDKFGTGVQFLSHFCPPTGWPGWKWKNDSVLFLSSICPHHLPWTDRTKWGQKWDNFETNDEKI